MNICPINTTKNSFKVHKKSSLPDFFLYIYVNIVRMHTHKQMSMNLPVKRFHKALKYPQAVYTSFTEKGHDKLH